MKIRTGSSVVRLKGMKGFLKRNHYDDCKRSGLSNVSIVQYGIRSLTAQEIRKLLKRSDVICGGYIINYPDGSFTIRLDTPIKGRKVKYLRLAGSECRLFITTGAQKVLNDTSVPYIMVEGEKKAIAADERGFPCISIPGVWGWSRNKKILPEFSELNLKDRIVYLAYDPDKESNPNVLLAEKEFAKALTGLGAIVKILDLPAKLDDYLVKEGAEALRQILDSAEDFQGANIPSIAVDPKDLRPSTDKVWQILRRANKDNPFLFKYAGMMVRVEYTGEGASPCIQPIDEFRLRHHMIRLANFTRLDKDGEKVPYYLGMDLLRDILSTPEMDLPPLNAIVRTPYFSREGELHTQAGYNKNTGMFYAPLRGFKMPDVSSNPTRSEMAKAKDLIMNHVLKDFPFQGVSDKAHAVGLLLLSFVQPIVGDPSPLHLIDKAAPGLGGTLLVRCIAYICTGDEFTSLPEGRDEEEWRKRITAVLMTAPQFIVIDNLSKPINSPMLASVLTSRSWQDRILGKTEHSKIPNQAVWAATGNNVLSSQEMARRIVRSRLEAMVENPHLRDPNQFRHPKILEWIKQNRGELVWAVCTMIQFWIKRDMPKSKKSLGMFESWAAVIGGILETLEIPGFLENLTGLYDDVNQETEGVKVFVSKWYEKHGESTVRVKGLLPIAILCNFPCESGFEKGEVGLRTSLGLEIKKLQGQVFDIQIKDNKTKQSVIKTIAIRKSDRKIENTTGWKLCVLNQKVVSVRIKIKKQGRQGIKGVR